jgi:hypothetical protein
VVSSSDRKSLEKTILRWYRDEPNAGLHSAIDYLLRHSKRGEVPITTNWNLTGELEKIDRQLSKKT